MQRVWSEALLESKDLADCTVVAGEQRIPAHSIVLAFHSPVFRVELCDGQWKESVSREIHISLEFWDCREIRNLLHHFYVGYRLLDVDSIVEFLAIADAYQVDLSKYPYLEDFEKMLRVNSCFDLLAKCKHYSQLELKNRVLEFVESNFEDLLLRDEIHHLSFKDFRKMLESKESPEISSASSKLNRKSLWVVEEDIFFLGILIWVSGKNTCLIEYLANQKVTLEPNLDPERFEQGVELGKFVQLGLLEKTFIVEIVNPTGLIHSDRISATVSHGETEYYFSTWPCVKLAGNFSVDKTPQELINSSYCPVVFDEQKVKVDAVNYSFSSGRLHRLIIAPGKHAILHFDRMKYGQIIIQFGEKKQIRGVTVLGKLDGNWLLWRKVGQFWKKITVFSLPINQEANQKHCKNQDIITFNRVQTDEVKISFENYTKLDWFKGFIFYD